MQRRPAKKSRSEMSPTMSDKTLLLEVEDLIALSFGGHGTNIVNFKMLESVLRILMRHMRLLEQDVEIKLEEEKEFLEEQAEKERLRQELEKQREGEAGAEESVQKQDTSEENSAKPSKKPKGKETESEPDKSDDKAAKADKKKDKEKDKGRKKEKNTDTEEGTKGKKKGASIKVTEVPTKDKKSRLVVERDDNVEDHPPRIGKIEVVNQEDFDALQTLVDHMLSKLKPATMPTMPEDLQNDLMEGNATMPDVMAELQVGSRVQATEKALTSMAGLLTQLAVLGALPEGVSKDMVKMRAELKNWGIDLSDVEKEAALKAKQSRKTMAAPQKSSAPKQQPVKETKPVAKPPEKKEVKPVEKPAELTKPELDPILKDFRRELLGQIASMTAKCTAHADTTNDTVNSLADQVQNDMKFVSRIENLRKTTTGHLEKLGGFGTGFTDRIKSFSEQLQALQEHLAVSVKRMLATTFNTEAVAAAELKKSYEVLSLEMERVLHGHSNLIGLQGNLDTELRVLLTNMEIVRDQKSTHHELMEGLKNKANLDALDGLLNEQILKHSCAELDAKLDECYDVFKKQDDYWMGCLHEMSAAAGTKADFMQLFSLREEASRHLTDINNTIAQLECCLGDPEVARLTRKLAMNAHCGACKVPALMAPFDKDHLKPPRLVAFREHSVVDVLPKPTFTTLKIPPSPDLRDHVSLRWTGGSHTLIHGKFAHEPAKVEVDKTHTKRTLGYGVDGRLYKMEMEIQPCEECYQADAPGDSGRSTSSEVSSNEATL